jgi:hypothetical protein
VEGSRRAGTRPPKLDPSPTRAFPARFCTCFTVANVELPTSNVERRTSNQCFIRSSMLEVRRSMFICPFQDQQAKVAVGLRSPWGRPACAECNPRMVRLAQAHHSPARACPTLHHPAQLSRFLVPGLCPGMRCVAGSACRQRPHRGGLGRNRGRASTAVRSQAEPGNEM